MPGADLPKVMYSLADAAQYQSAKILVVGGGDSAAEAALGLSSQDGNLVTLSYRKDRFYRIKRKNQERVEEHIRRETIRPLFSSSVLGFDGKSVRLRAENGELEIEKDWIFILIGGEPPYPFLRNVGIRFGDHLGESVAL